jgi:glucan phosphoethanolaminetransferase (alkaline phosphatase superfamily)
MSSYKRVLNAVLGDDLVSKIINVFLVLGYLCVAFFYFYIKNIDCSNICEEDILFAFSVKWVGSILIYFFVTSAIIWHIWRYESEPKKRKAKMNVIASIALGLSLVFYVGSHYFEVTYLNNVYDEGMSKIVESNKESLFIINTSDRSVEDKNRSSNSLARMAFKFSGMKLEITNSQGDIVVYKPTDEDLEYWRNMESTNIEMQETLHLHKMEMIWSLLLFLGSIAVGCAAVVARRFYQSRAS